MKQQCMLSTTTKKKGQANCLLRVTLGSTWRLWYREASSAARAVSMFHCRNVRFAIRVLRFLIITNCDTHRYSANHHFYALISASLVDKTTLNMYETGINECKS